jgi:hypothetical protein
VLWSHLDFPHQLQVRFLVQNSTHRIRSCDSQLSLLEVTRRDNPCLA